MDINNYCNAVGLILQHYCLRSSLLTKRIMGRKKKQNEIERAKMKEGDTVQSEKTKWRIITLLGSGGFGDVYKVAKVDNPDKTEYAMKTEMMAGNRRMLRLKIEVVILMKCHQQTGPERRTHFVEFIDRGKTLKFKAIGPSLDDIRQKYLFLVMGLVGPSLEDIRQKYLVRNFSPSTAMHCCIQTLNAVRDIHSLGYLHRDIKPQNFSVGIGAKERNIYMLDFGIARKFTEGATNTVRVPRIKVHFLGTVRFASRACHKQIEQGRKDDLECWLYMAFDLFDDNNGLSWKRCVREDVFEKKEQFFRLECTTCFNIVPKEFGRIVKYIDGLKYSDGPDYGYLLNTIAHIAKENQIDFTKPVDWSGLAMKKIESIREKTKMRQEHIFRVISHPTYSKNKQVQERKMTTVQGTSPLNSDSESVTTNFN
ncbi:hypothetical protein DICVIV_04003, partial [Dictyocaulus viviparus]